jgi:hypothetical protein
MPRTNGHDWLIERYLRQAALRAAARRRESLLGLLLATLSAGLGLFLCAVTITGIVGKPAKAWTVPYTVRTPATPRRYEWDWDPKTGEDIRRVVRVPARTLHLPNAACVMLGCFGLVLGVVVGLLEARRGRALSPTATAGVALPVLTLIFAVSYVAVLEWIY